MKHGSETGVLHMSGFMSSPVSAADASSSSLTKLLHTVSACQQRTWGAAQGGV
jgi:hypothetical protein